MRGPGEIRVTVYPSDRAAARALAQRIAAAVADKPALVLGLPTGRTPIRMYQELVALASHGRADFSHIRTFNLDEFLGIEPSHPGSYRMFMEDHFFKPARLHADGVSRPTRRAERAHRSGTHGVAVRRRRRPAR